MSVFPSSHTHPDVFDAPQHSQSAAGPSGAGFAGHSEHLNQLDNSSASTTTRLPTKHFRSQTEGQYTIRNFGKFSKLLATVLGSPFASSSASPISSDRARISDTRSRSPSPSPSVEYSVISIPSSLSIPQYFAAEDVPTPLSMRLPSPTKNSFPGSLSSMQNPIRTGGKRILPRLWTTFTSPPRDPGVRMKRKGKGKAIYFDGRPLDGEEGELIDDEACFVDIPIRFDIMSRLPPEISLYLLLFLDLSSVLVCLMVSRNWRRLASDPVVWRSLFHSNGWEINIRLAWRRLTSGSITRVGRTNSIISTPRNEIDISFGRARKTQTPPSTPTTSPNTTQPYHGISPVAVGAGTSHRQSVCSMSTTAEMGLSSPGLRGSSSCDDILAPLTLDWQSLYKTRLEIQRRVRGTSGTASATGEGSVGADPFVMKLVGHLDSVYCLEFDAYKIVTGSRDRTIKVWSLRTGKLKSTLHGHEGSVLCLKFDSSGFMVSGSSDCKILVWDLGRGDVRKALTGHQGGVLDLQVDKKWLVSCSKDAVIRVWDRDTLNPHCSLHGHNGPVNAVGLQDGKIVSVSGDGGMILWDIATASRIRTFETHDPGLTSIEFKDDYICSGSNDRKIRIRSSSTGKCLRTLTGHTALVRALSFNPRTGLLVSASYDKTIKLWDIHSGVMIREFSDAHQSHIFDVKFDASHIVSTSHDHTIVVHDWSFGLDPALCSLLI